MNAPFARRALRLGLALAPLLLSACPTDAPPPNAPPVVELGGEETVLVGETVHLDAVASDPDGDALTYEWSWLGRPEGSNAELSADGASAHFVADAAGRFEVQVTVSDGEAEASASAVVRAEAPPYIDGSLTVTVIDAETGAPIEGATVRIDGRDLTGHTDASGQVTLEDASLAAPETLHVEGPGTVSYDADLDPTTPAKERPAYRGATLVDAVSAELVVPLWPSDAAKAARPRGTLTGQIDFDLFDRLPAIAPMLSLDAGEVVSEQLRAVVIAPMPEGGAADLAVGDLLGRPHTPTFALPGNLTTDDAVLNSLGVSLLGLPPELEPDPLTKFVVDAPAGRQRFFVLGGLVSVDTSALVPALTGGGTDPGALFGSMRLDILFVGLVELDVPSGGTRALEAPLRPGDLQVFLEVPATVTFEEDRVPWPFDPSTMVSRRHAVVAPAAVATAEAPAALPDPRVADHLPDRTRVEIKNPDGTSKDPKEYVWLDVPADTGVPETEVPYTIAVALADTEAGRLPFGLDFVRAAPRSRPASAFGVPDFGQAFAAPTLEVELVTTRGIWANGPRAEYRMLEGRAVVRAPLAAGETTPASGTLSLPRLLDPDDPGPQVYLQCRRSDESTAVVDGGCTAYVSRLTAPDPAVNTLPPALPERALPQDGDLVHLVVRARSRFDVPTQTGSREVARDDALWDLYRDFDAAAMAPLALPAAATAALEPGDEVAIELRVERYDAPLDMARWSGERLRSGPQAFSSDTFLYVR
ncbi:MAG: hypothetical protein D6729_00215 [Deltaproteobacteria bacterium]|nr:MAG: hypothetical protein D6729_00215 [Deltaproteobacteria bacterium]